MTVVHMMGKNPDSGENASVVPGMDRFDGKMTLCRPNQTNSPRNDVDLSMSRLAKTIRTETPETKNVDL